MDIIDKEKRDKWYHNYIDNVNTDNIEWVKLNYDELVRFYYNNYYDEEYDSYVSVHDLSILMPFGLTYLTYNRENSRLSYMLGLVNNNIGKKTIVSCMIYYDKYLIMDRIDKPITYILSVETNVFFQRKGIFKEMISNILRFVDNNQPILITGESRIGKTFHSNTLIKNILLLQGFKYDFYDESKITDNYIYLLTSYDKVKVK